MLSRFRDLLSNLVPCELLSRDLTVNSVDFDQLKGVVEQMSSPAVSVLMPVYNAAATVGDAIRSVLNQTHDDFELLVVNDGSTDSTAERAVAAANGDNRFRLIDIDHAGLIPALNAGLLECRDEFLARMDGDDISHPDRLQLQVQYLIANPQISVCSSLVRSFPQSAVRDGFRKYEIWLNSLTEHSEISRDFFIESPVAHPSVMLRTEELRELGGYVENNWPEDYDLWLRYYTAGKHFGKVPRYLLFWRAHTSRLTFTDSRYALENFIRAKAHYLAKYLGSTHREVIVWGAGMTGRRLSKHLVREGVKVRLVVDIDQAKTGKTMRGIPIVPPDTLQECGGVMIIAAVGSEGARERIREYLVSIGRKELRDFICAA